MRTERLIYPRRYYSFFIKVVLLSLILLLSPLPTGRAASTIMVNSQEDTAKNDGICTLREAVIAANKDQRSGSKPGECIAGSGADTIVLPPLRPQGFPSDLHYTTVYEITRSDSGNENSSSTGDLDFLDDVSLEGQEDDLNTIVIEGIDINDRIIHVLSGDYVSISGITLRGGNVPQSGGGLKNEAMLTLTNVKITGNHAQENGGGLVNVGTLVMIGSTVAGNTADLDNHEFINSGIATLTNSTISGHGLSNSGMLDLSFVTVVGATAVTGGTLNATNTIFTICNGTITSQGYNLIANTSACTIEGDLTGNIINQAPLLGPLTDNGGPTPTHALLNGSPAIEAGSNALCPATDQRGVTRPGGLVCDIGAYEEENPLQSGLTVIVNMDEDSDDGECSFVHCTLREAINVVNDTAHTIEFNISGDGPFIIRPLSPLPVLTRPVTLNGTTQPGGVVILDGALAGSTADGLTLAGGDSLVLGFTVTNFDCTGIVLDGVGGNFIEGNTITGNGCHGIQILSGVGNTIQGNSISNNGLLGIALNSNDDVTVNDIGDGDGGANDGQNFPVLAAAVDNSSDTLVKGRLNSTANTLFTLEFFSNTSCDTGNYGEGETNLGTAVVATNSKGNVLFKETVEMVGANDKFVTATATDENGNTSEFSQCVAIGPDNVTWFDALELTVVPNLSPTTVEQFIDAPNRSRWYKFSVQPGSWLYVTLTQLQENFDVTIYKDISAASDNVSTLQDLARIDAEFATNAFNPDALAPDAFSSDAFAPDAYAPDAYAPDAYAPDAYAPDAYASAQTRSLLAVSANPGILDESVSLNTWLNDGVFYIRVRGRQGVFSLDAPFLLGVQLIGNDCIGVSSNLPDITTMPDPMVSNLRTLILTDLPRMEEGIPGQQAILEGLLDDLAARPEVVGEIIDLSQDARVLAANQQADDHPACPYAKNLVFKTLKEIVDIYREQNPNMEYITVVGNDEVIPFERYPDHALLANEVNYSAPVLPTTASFFVHDLGYFLTQDRLGSSVELSRKVNAFPLPDLAVGRLVETMSDVIVLLQAYLGTTDGVVDTPTHIAATGYDFIEDAANAIVDELEAGTGVTANTLILTGTLSPADPQAWTAEQLAELMLANRQDLMFIGAHFSANSLLAADYTTRLTTEDLAASSVDFTNSIIFSIGCHGAYNIVNEHGVPDVTEVLDWPQAFNQRGATLIASTAYAYGHTELLKYSERLHLLFSQQLRTGSDLVSIGQAFVAAKQEYLATVQDMRGIDEKSLLAATIYGLPMLSVNMLGDRLTPTDEPSIVGSLTPFTTNPGATLGLSYADVTINPSLTTNTVELTNINDISQSVVATYLSGSDGEVANPAEIVLPLERENISLTSGLPRGVGLRSGSYIDLPNIFPLTNSATTEIRGIHMPVTTDTFYPVKMWQINQFDLLSVGDPTNGQTQLAVSPAQFRSDSLGSDRGILRKYTNMVFRIFSSNVMTPSLALSDAPTIDEVSAVADSGSLHFQARVTSNPAVGNQLVWIVYTANNGLWDSFDLEQNNQDTTLWEGVMPLNGTPVEDIRYFVQAVNGVGLVAMDTNLGQYYSVGDDAAPTETTALTLELSPSPGSGAYGTEASFSAVLTSATGPVAGEKVVFVLGSQTRQAETDGDGRATVELNLLGRPGTYEIQASFLGAGDLKPSTATAGFQITKQMTALELFNPDEDVEPHPIGLATDANILEAFLSAGDRNLPEKTVFFVVTGAGGGLSQAVITDNEGKAVLGNLHLAAGTYNVTASFSGPITLDSGIQFELEDARYLPSTAVGTVELLNTPPQAADDAYDADEGVPLVVAAPGVLVNDNDVNGDGLSAVLVADPTHGSVVLNGDGSFTYTSDEDYNGPDSFTYQADDGSDTGNVATVTITVNPLNDAPVAVDDDYSVVAGNTLTIDALDGVLANDTDVDGDGLTAVLDTDPGNGLVTLNSDGSFSYTPNMGFVGDDFFTYQADDGQVLSNMATVTITVLPANTSPDCSGATTNVTFIWPPDKNFWDVNILGVTDADGDPIAIIIDSIFQDEPVGHGNNSPDGMGIGTDTAQVRAERSGNGNGRVYHITFTADDGQGGSCSVELALPVVDHDLSPEEMDDIDGGPLYDSTQSS